MTTDSTQGDLKKQTFSLFWILHMLMMVPFLIVKSIPASDYSNHLARIATLVRDGNTPLFPTMYHTNFHFRPYLGFDVPAWLLSHVVSFDMAGKIFMVLVLTAWNFGLFMLARSRGNIGIAGCLPILLTFNMVTIQGFLPFMAGMAFIPWYLIVFSKSSPWVRALPALILFPVAIFASHQLALLMFILGGFCFLFDSESTPSNRKVQAIQLGILFVLNIAYFKLAKFGDSSGSIEFGSLSHKLHNLTEAFLTGSMKFDLLYIFIVLVVVAVLAAKKKVAFNRLAMVFLLVPFALFLVFPNKVGLAENIDYRFVLFGLSLCFACLVPNVTTKSELRSIGVVLLALVAARSVMVAKNFRLADTRLAEAREAMKQLPGAPAIIVATVGEHSQWESSQWKPMSYSVANFAAVDRTAYVNTLFQEPSMMTISHGDIGRALDYVGRRDGRASNTSVVELINEATQRAEKLPAAAQSQFTYYLIVVSTDLEPLPKLPSSVHDGSYFSIYKIATGQSLPNL